eukprot:CAMPEP_0201577904 /NCGR_PEP_ID=MMETSP0190_2-20130828/24477_1 /ASSEMBLY_ACC=CAM_ASM_000263 /TAXON_ID=37353 /ORGANISM="Rosalina sp." /LENGTH=228 /DNA_ID=CAMNT_0048010441 /DNA_START=70 /DNA_END=756 /DNA_ORIENTATION=-
MGCCMASMATNMMENAYAQQGQIAAQAAQQPRQLATGDTLVPMNYITGEYPSVYPSWFNQQQITTQTWTQLIQALNQVTMPALAQSKANSLNMVNDAMKPTLNVNTAMNRNMQYQATQMQIQQQLIEATDRILLSYNQQLFQPMGLQATSSYSAYATMHAQGGYAYGGMAPQIGIMIKKTQQPQVVYVVQQGQQAPVQQQPVQVVQVQAQPQAQPPMGTEGPPAYTAQ